MSDARNSTAPDPSRNGALRVTVVSCHDYAWATVRELSQMNGVPVVLFTMPPIAS